MPTPEAVRVGRLAEEKTFAAIEAYDFYTIKKRDQYARDPDIELFIRNDETGHDTLVISVAVRSLTSEYDRKYTKRWAVEPHNLERFREYRNEHGGAAVYVFCDSNGEPVKWANLHDVIRLASDGRPITKTDGPYPIALIWDSSQNPDDAEVLHDFPWWGTHDA